MKINYSYPAPKANPDTDFGTFRLTEDDQVRVAKNGDAVSVEIGIGPFADMNRRKLITVIRKILRTAKQHKVSKIAIDAKSFALKGMKRIEDTDLGTLIGENAEMANFEYIRFKEATLPNQPVFVTDIAIMNSSPALKKGIEKGQVIGEEVNQSRSLSNTPAGDLSPQMLADEAKKATNGTAIAVTILDEKEIESLGMGALYAVGKGSGTPPRFIVMEYWGGAKSQKPIVFVGKGVTFDTGGINIKPDDHSLGMHLDMSGGAAVIHAITAAAKLRLKKNIIALIPAVENMVSGTSYRPGDILRSLSGKTIEVINTDAEGRLILADALTYAEKYHPRLVVDAATLTGGALVALGEVASAIMTRDESLEKIFRKLGEESGDYVWPLPLWDEYAKGVKGIFADLANLNPKGNSRYASSIMGGMFLYQFAKKYPWVHMDIAPRMESTDGDELAPGSIGAPVRLLVRLAEQF